MNRFVTIRRASCVERRLARYRAARRPACPKGQGKNRQFVRRQRQGCGLR